MPPPKPLPLPETYVWDFMLHKSLLKTFWIFMGKTVFSSFLNGLMVHEVSDFLVSWLVQCTVSEMCSPLFSLSFLL
jgi:hypothetical protein